MVPGENQWDRDLVLDYFDEKDANLIMAIPLSNEENDTSYGEERKFGNYTVKSAYCWIREIK